MRVQCSVEIKHNNPAQKQSLIKNTSATGIEIISIIFVF